jgi:hypothetical protein
MRKCFLAAFAAPLIILSSTGAYCQDTESALGDPAPEAVQDPSLSNSRYFPPSLGTSGVAAIATTPNPSHAAACGPANPCALATPARDHVIVAQGRP